MSAKDLAALVNAALKDIVTGEPLFDDARVDLTAHDLRPVAALLTRLAEVDGEMDTTEEERALWSNLDFAYWRSVAEHIRYSGEQRLLRDIDHLRLKVAEQDRLLSNVVSASCSSGVDEWTAAMEAIQEYFRPRWEAERAALHPKPES